MLGGGLVTPADSKNTSLGMGLSIAFKLEGECPGGCDSRRLPGCFLFQQAF